MIQIPWSMHLEFKFEIVVKKTVWEKTTHKNGSNRCMIKTFFFIFHLPRPNWTCLSVSHIVPVNFIENHWSLMKIVHTNNLELSSLWCLWISLWMVSGWLEPALLADHYRIWNSEYRYYFSSFPTSSTYTYLNMSKVRISSLCAAHLMNEYGVLRGSGSA